MIASKKAQAAANRHRIARALVALQERGDAINVQAVARAAGVHSDTIRRNPDLLAEVRHLRDEQWRIAPAPAVANHRTQVDAQELKARLLDAQAEISQLRRDLSQALRAAHNTLAREGEVMSREDADRLQREATELRVQTIALHEQLAREQELRERINDELTATNEVNRDLMRELTASKERELTLRQSVGRSMRRSP